MEVTGGGKERTRSEVAAVRRAFASNRSRHSRRNATTAPRFRASRWAPPPSPAGASVREAGQRQAGELASRAADTALAAAIAAGRFPSLRLPNMAAAGSRAARRPALATPRGSGDRTVFLFDRRREQADPDEKVLSYGNTNYRGFRSAVCQVPGAVGEGRQASERARRRGRRGRGAPQPPPTFRLAAAAPRARGGARGSAEQPGRGGRLRLPRGERTAAAASLPCPRTFLPGRLGGGGGDTAPAALASPSTGHWARRAENTRAGRPAVRGAVAGAAAPGGGRERSGRHRSSPARGTDGGGRMGRCPWCGAEKWRVGEVLFVLSNVSARSASRFLS